MDQLMNDTERGIVIAEGRSIRLAWDKDCEWQQEDKRMNELKCRR